MRPVEFGEPLLAGTRLTLFSDHKPDCFFLPMCQNFSLTLEQTVAWRKIEELLECETTAKRTAHRTASESKPDWLLGEKSNASGYAE
jgi:hypothetical protein